MKLPLLAILVGLGAGVASGQTNLVKNPSFEEDAQRRGTPDHWQTSGDAKTVSQTLALDKGRDSKRCARLACTRFDAGNSASHAMLCQLGVPVRRGASYRLSFWAKAEDLVADAVSIALSDTASWQNCGLEDSFAPDSRWERFDCFFRATRDCSTASRFQIWFTSTGTLWIDDIEFRELAPGEEAFRPGKVVPAAGHKNLIPNASFECGTDGWGSAESDRLTHWGGGLNTLFGQCDPTNALDGKASLKIHLSPENRPISWFDYYQLSRAPILAPLAGNFGFLEVERGQRYTLSVWMKAEQADTPARLAVRQFQAGTLDKPVRVSTKWERYSLTITPTARWCCVMAGPDLRPTRENRNPPSSATLWLDAFQLEKGDRATEFAPYAAEEFGLRTTRPGNVFDWDEPLRFSYAVAGRQGESREAKLELRLEDFLDREVWHDASTVKFSSAKFASREIVLDPAPERRGFLRLKARLTAGNDVQERTLRLSVIPARQGADSRFGVNHAYSWPHLLDLCRQAGLGWARDWSLKWQEVEPEKGQFTFAETDLQIDRPRKHGLQVLGLLPFPSSNWSSSAPESVSGKGGYPQNRARVAYAPRDMAEFENYVEKTVAHYKGRIAWWQVLNEPLYTDYALPRKLGYDGTTYGNLAQAFAKAARRADPNCHILAGIGGLSGGQILDDFDRIFATGVLKSIDAVDVHHYPTLRAPEHLEGLLAKLRALMDKHGGRKPIWITECGYYADDEPASVPMSHQGFNRPLSSEQRQAEYAVRWGVIALANGVDKVFYHAGTCQGLNDDNLEGVFYKYGGEGRKIYAAQAVMAHLLTPSAKFVKPLSLGAAAKAYLFQDGSRLIGVIWSPERAKPEAVRLTNDKLALWDLMGRPQQAREFTPSGTPVYIIAEGIKPEAFEAGMAAR